ncbi:hypothetical protein VPAG_00008 [Vibrio phage douglas 12A4]|uniref:hypothetical protein n=1 Tax=Vibrio phage douglas 12A4 TaxID=573171 RepID=UPI0002C04964|nr:hypothetical protein VPAG_00008 [Vibrio phage douglas 12A4]AGG58044.1 hypothetical protein VPAG_00008 [Vibrio phage douglas 12A4]
MFKEYKSKPITRLAHEITQSDLDTLKKIGESMFHIVIHEQDTTDHPVSFKAYEDVKVGDFIVYLDSSDIYHCSRKVFEERNEI